MNTNQLSNQEGGLIDHNLLLLRIEVTREDSSGTNYATYHYVRANNVESIEVQKQAIVFRVLSGGAVKLYKIEEVDCKGYLSKSPDYNEIANSLLSALGMTDMVDLPAKVIGPSGVVRHLKISA